MSNEISSLAVDIPAAFIAECAAGVEEPNDIRIRFGISDDQWAKLENYQPFVVAVLEKRAELEKSGASFRTKSKLKAEMLSDKIFVRVMAPDAPAGAMLSALEHYVRVADLNPKTQVQSGTPGSAFSITINLPGPATPAKDVVTIEHIQPEKLPIYMEGKPIDELPRD